MNLWAHVPVGIWCQNDVVSTSMRRDDVASTLIRRHFYVMCPLGSYQIHAIFLCRASQYVIVIQRYVRLCEGAIHELLRADFLPYRRASHGITIAYHPHQCRPYLVCNTLYFVPKVAISGKDGNQRLSVRLISIGDVRNSHSHIFHIFSFSLFFYYFLLLCASLQ